MAQVVAGAGGLTATAYGSSGFELEASWWSADGIDWHPSEDPDTAHILRGLLEDGLHTLGGDIFAFVARNEAEDWVDIDRVEVWRSNNGRDWDNVAALPESDQIFQLGGAASNETGFVAISIYPLGAWFSPNGTDWHVSHPPRVLKRTEYFALGATDRTFVAASGLYGGFSTGIFNSSNVTGQTSTSMNGMDWQTLDDRAWNGSEIVAMFTIGRNLIGVGRTYGEDYMPHGSIWSAPFPEPR